MLVALILVGPRFNPWDQHLFNKLIDDGDRFNSDQNLVRIRSAQICSDLLRFSVSDQNLLTKFGPISAIWGQKNSERIRSVPIRFRSEYPPHSKDLIHSIHTYNHQIQIFNTNPTVLLSLKLMLIFHEY